MKNSNKKIAAIALAISAGIAAPAAMAQDKKSTDAADAKKDSKKGSPCGPSKKRSANSCGPAKPSAPKDKKAE